MSPSSPYLVAMATEPPSTPEYEENIFLPVLVVLIQRKSAVIVLTRVGKYKTTYLGPHIAEANPYNSTEGPSRMVAMATNFIISTYNTQKHI